MGEYMVDLAIEMREREGDRFLGAPGDPPPTGVREMGIELIVEQIRDTLSTFGTTYDRWFSERSLYEPTGDGEASAYDAALAILRENGHLAEREGALWLTSSNLGEDKDNVVVRSDGRPTYFASDIAYHYDKFLTRGFDQVINVWGADHHGHVSRLEVGTEAVTGKGGALHLLLYQLVTLKRGSETVRLSKRGGEIITLDELIEEVGPDAARFFFLLRAPSSQMDFDLDLAVKQSNENPVFYIQYAHARLASILDRASGEGHTPDGGDVALLTAGDAASLRGNRAGRDDVRTTAPRALRHGAGDLVPRLQRRVPAARRPEPEGDHGRRSPDGGPPAAGAGREDRARPRARPDGHDRAGADVAVYRSAPCSSLAFGAAM